MECKHFKRGKLFDDNTCARICRDEIMLVDDLGEKLLSKNLPFHINSVAYTGDLFGCLVMVYML